MRRGRRRSRAAAAPNRWKGRQPAVRGAGLLVGWPAGGPSTLLTRRGQLDDALYSCAVPVLCLCCERCGARAALLRAALLPLVPLTRRRVESVW